MKLVGQLGGGHRVRQILFVRKHQQNRVSQLVLLEHTLQLFFSFDDSLPIIGIYDKDQTLRILEVVTPQRTDFVLATDVPNRKADVLVLDRFYVESDGGNGRDNFTQLQLVQDCCFTGGIQTNCKWKELRKRIK